MSLLTMGANIRNAGLGILEQVGVGASEAESVLASLVSARGVNGAVILSTCNRIEAYVDAQTDQMGFSAMGALFESRLGTPLPDGTFRQWRGTGAARHLFRVTCSLDSLVLGEPQVLGQVRSSYEAAQSSGTCTEALDRLFRDALALGKRVRAQTEIGAESVSLSTIAVKAAMRELPDLAKRHVLVIGSGKMARLAIEYLRERGVRNITVTSRTQENARELARSSNARCIPFAQRYDAIDGADVVFTMTSAPEAVIEAGNLQPRAPQRKLVIIDEAMPRDSEPECGAVPGVVVYDINSLSALSDEGLATRMAAVDEVELLIDQALEVFLGWMQQRNATPTVRIMHEKGAAVVAREVEKAARELARAQGSTTTPEQRAVLDALGTAVMKKLLHGPTVRLKKGARNAESYYYTDAARYLFGIDAFPPGSPSHHRREAEAEPERRPK